MFARSKILGVNNGSLRIRNSPSYIPMSKSPKANLTASLVEDSISGGSSVNKSITAFWQSNYQYMMTGIIPATPEITDSSALALFYRDMYLHDSVAGSAIDIQSTFPFSDWELRGLSAEDLDIFNKNLERLNIQDLLPMISISYLMDGFFVGSLVFEQRTKQFMDILIHDPLCCTQITSPFNNIDPVITVHTNGVTKQFLENASKYTEAYLRTMPPAFINLLQNDAFDLDPVSTLYVARRVLGDRAYTSYLQRLLPCYLIEKALFRGTIVEAQRRQRATTHIQAGDDQWVPTDEELQSITRLFQSTESDPLGAWIATRSNIQISDFRQAGDIWKWYETAEQLTPIKLRSLGISDAFLAGDASFAASESAYSTFVETVNAYRTHLTNKIFYTRLFPLIAVVNDLYVKGVEKPKYNSIQQFLFNAANRQNLRLPELHWHKQLEVRDEQSQFDRLSSLAEHGVPIPISLWIAAAGLDINALLKDLKESKDLEKQLAPYMKKSEEDGGDDFDISASSSEVDAVTDDELASWTTQSFKNKWTKLRKKPLLSRKFNESDLAEWDVKPSGKRTLKVHQEAAKKDRMWKLAKIIAKYDRDKNYRNSVVKRNQLKGISKLKGF